jgi:uncharacterized YkwD family protein
MRKISKIIFSMFFILSMAACNGNENAGETRNEFLTGDDVNYHTGNSRTNADGKLARSTVSYKPSGHQTRKISFNNEQNTRHGINRLLKQQVNRNQQGNTNQQGLNQGTTGETNQGTAPGATGNQANQGQAGQPAGDFIGQVVDLTNQQRQKNGLGPISADNELQKAAQMKSDDMSQNNYFSHTSPTYGSPFQMLKDLGIEYQVAAENIASGQRSPEEVVNAWMNSPGHRKNILNKDITHIGVGYAPSGSYWTQLFIKK